eukprot:GSChrysophyteH1.ASY1.ANO1.2600.1 assembled CDS
MLHITPAPKGSSVSDIMNTFGDRIFRPKVICIILTVVNLLNYVDRGIVPGSTNEFDAFILRNINTDSPDVYLGLLQSAFIVGFCVASVVCGHAVHSYPPFFLSGIGLTIWCFAVLFSGIALWTESYYFLLIARMFSGCGEASFQCSVPPWIQSNCEEGTQGTWLSIFYTAIPVGTAVGYVYSALISDSIGAKWAFFIEGVLMIPFVLITEQVTEKLLNTPQVSPGHYDPDDIDSINNKNIDSVAHRLSMIDEMVAIFSRPLYVIVALGYAAQTGSLIGVATFGSAFLMGLGYYNTETQSSSIFGIIVSIGGITGTLAGGYFLDKAIQRETAAAKRSRESVEESCNLIAISNSLGALCMWSAYFIYDKTLFMITLCVGCSLIFFATPGISIAAMNAVKVENRAFAMAMMSVILHGLGDVPSPILSGLIKDKLAPACIGSNSATDACRADSHGLRETMLIITLWLVWTIGCFWLARFMSTRPALRCDKEDDVNSVEKPDSSHLDEPLIN